MEGKEEDVRLGANKFNERQPIGTAAQTHDDKDYTEPPPAPLFEPVKGFEGKQQFQLLGGGANSVAGGYTKGDGLGAEIVGTFVLVYTVFSATDAKRSARDSHVPILAPLPIGFAVFLVHLATIPITGTGINPARSLGAAIVFNQDKGWDDHWIFWVGPFIGAALAALYHTVVIRAIPFKK
ncbi:unnamed protein product [Linum tenue]|uniref:Uncharacterized protein n=1 Tax=Linum tenue TaxID=586396 RepID=A0AAV0JQP2_9ROSI|nr:unnamed protein product [Linum tenue]